MCVEVGMEVCVGEGEECVCRGGHGGVCGGGRGVHVGQKKKMWLILSLRVRKHMLCILYCAYMAKELSLVTC